MLAKFDLLCYTSKGEKYVWAYNINEYSEQDNFTVTKSGGAPLNIQKG